MAWSITDRFPTWGENGDFPVDGFFYEGGDQINEKHLDALWNGVKEFENETRGALEEIDSDGDGVVDEADYANDANASTFKNNDIDSNGDGKVDAAEEADNADTVGGESPSAFADTNHGNEEHNSSFTTLTEVNNNADVPNADFADNASRYNGLSPSDGNSGEFLSTNGTSVSWNTVTHPIFGNGSDGSIVRSTNGTEDGILTPTDYTLESGNTITVDSGNLIILATKSITVNGTIDASGNIYNNGGAGATGSNLTNGGDGGSSAGNVFLMAPTVEINGSILVNGENGQDGQDAAAVSAANDQNKEGNDGANGEISIFADGVGGASDDGTLGGGGGGGQTTSRKVTYGGDAPSREPASAQDSIRLGRGSSTFSIITKLFASGGGGGGATGTLTFGGELGGGGGGGGGNGGVVFIQANTILDNGTVTTNAGLGGTGGNGDGGGPAGGDGGNGISGIYLKMEA